MDRRQFINTSRKQKRRRTKVLPVFPYDQVVGQIKYMTIPNIRRLSYPLLRLLNTNQPICLQFASIWTWIVSELSITKTMCLSGSLTNLSRGVIQLREKIEVFNGYGVSLTLYIWDNIKLNSIQ